LEKVQKKQKPTGGKSMRKLLVVLMVLAFAASAFALEVKFSGDFMVKQNIQNGFSLVTDKDNRASGDYTNYTYWEQDMNVYTKFIVDKQTTVTMRVAIMDKTWGVATAANTDDDIQVERAWMTYKFNDMFTLDAGKMTGGAFATSFSDNAGGKDQVKLTVKIPTGKLIAVYRMVAENGAISNVETDDTDLYNLAYVGKFGPTTAFLRAARVYKDDGASGNEVQTILTAAAMGDYGMFGFEAEYENLNWKTDNDTTRDDVTVYGLYANVYAKVAGWKIGGKYAKGTVKKKDNKTYAFAFNDDFDGTAILGDQLGFGSGGNHQAVVAGSYNSGADQGLTGMNLYQLYVSGKVMEKIGLSANYSYITSNHEANVTGDNEAAGYTYLDDIKAHEYGVSASYALTDATTYSIGASFAKVNDMKNAAGNKKDSELMSYYWQKIGVKF